MHLAFFSDLGAFRQQASPLLKTRCAVNSLKLGILAHCRKHGERSGSPLLALGVKQGEVVAVFVLARSLYFYASEAHLEEAMACAADEFLDRRIQISSVMGYGETATRFAECWGQRTQAKATLAGKDTLYELTATGDPGPTRGTLQRATFADVPELKRLFREYYREDLGVAKADRDLERTIAQHLADDEVYCWLDRGVKSMATAMLPFDAGVELANVFTVPEHRRQGYAAACVGETCTTLLQRYPRVVLFVDQGNRAANALYTKIGFRLVDEMSTYRFSAVA